MKHSQNTHFYPIFIERTRLYLSVCACALCVVCVARHRSCIFTRHAISKCNFRKSNVNYCTWKSFWDYHATLFEIPRSRNLLHRCYGRVNYAPHAMPFTTFVRISKTFPATIICFKSWLDPKSWFSAWRWKPWSRVLPGSKYMPLSFIIAFHYTIALENYYTIPNKLITHQIRV